MPEFCANCDEDRTLAARCEHCAYIVPDKGRGAFCLKNGEPITDLDGCDGFLCAALVE